LFQCGFNDVEIGGGVEIPGCEKSVMTNPEILAPLSVAIPVIF
jgi:hypothetical protein